MSVQVGAHYLEKAHGGRGMLLGGVPGVPGANVVIIGGGVVGTNAAQMALGMGANVTIVDSPWTDCATRHVLHGRVHTLASNTENVAAAVQRADLIVGRSCSRAPRRRRSSRGDGASMRPGSVVVDVAIDQGGCIATARPTSHSEPTYVGRGGPLLCDQHAGGRAADEHACALERDVALRLAAGRPGLLEAAEDPELANGVNVLNGRITHPGVAEAFGLEYTPLVDAPFASAAV